MHSRKFIKNIAAVWMVLLKILKKFKDFFISIR